MQDGKAIILTHQIEKLSYIKVYIIPLTAIQYFNGYVYIKVNGPLLKCMLTRVKYTKKNNAVTAKTTTENLSMKQKKSEFCGY